MKIELNSLFYVVITLCVFFIVEVVSCVEVNIVCASGRYGDDEINWEIKKDNAVLISGVGNETKSGCLPVGLLTVVGKDSGGRWGDGDGWTGATLTVVGKDGFAYLDKWEGPLYGAFRSKEFNVVLRCPVGTYGITNCTNCSNGTFGNIVAQQNEESACPFNATTCPYGHFCRYRVAIPCKMGTFNDLLGQSLETACKNCMPGYVALSEGSRTCAPCATGSYCQNTTSTTECPIGTFNKATKQTSKTACKICTSGHVAFSKGSQACAPCATGSYCPNATSQIDCPIGTFNDVKGKTSCKPCLAGRIALSKGSAICSECETGSYCPNATSQIDCPIGTFNEGNKTSETSCIKCTETTLTCETKKFVLACGMQDSICDRCHEHCQHCDIDGKTCLECRHNMYLHNGTCIHQCPDGYVHHQRNWVRSNGRMVGNKCVLNLVNSVITGWGMNFKGAYVPAEIQFSTQVKTIVASWQAFAALNADGSVVAWGDPLHGGSVPHEAGDYYSGYPNVDVTKLKNIVRLFSGKMAFVALTNESSIISWGFADEGGYLPEAVSKLKNVKEVFAEPWGAFVALTYDGAMVGWGGIAGSGISNKVPSHSNIKTIFSTTSAFAALTDENSVVSFGYIDDPAPEVTALKNIKTIFSTGGAFVALTNEGSLVAWGASSSGGSLPPAIASLINIKTVFSTGYAFCAITNESSVVAWGSSKFGGSVPLEIAALRNIKTVFSTSGAFAALTSAGSVVSWGYWLYGGTVPPEIAALRNIKTVFSTPTAFVAITKSGSAVSWGIEKEREYNWEAEDHYKMVVPTTILRKQNIDKKGASTPFAMAGLTFENGVESWGDIDNGGLAPPAVSSQNIDQNVRHIVSNCCSFVASKVCNGESFADDTLVCVSCESGFSTNGAVNNIGKDSCEACKPGQSRSNDMSQVQCQECEIGHYQNEYGSSLCNACDMGKFVNNAGQTQCLSCPEGTYQDAAGQRNCIPCPIDSFSATTGNTAATQCLKCITDFALFTTTDNVSGVANTSGCVCQGIDEAIEGNVGYYTNPMPTNKEDFCLKCPNGASCTNPNTTLSTLGTQRGYWRASEKSHVFHECLNDIDCPGNSNHALQCRAGNTGVICAVCAANYVRFDDGLCYCCCCFFLIRRRLLLY